MATAKLVLRRVLDFLCLPALAYISRVVSVNRTSTLRSKVRGHGYEVKAVYLSCPTKLHVHGLVTQELAIYPIYVHTVA